MANETKKQRYARAYTEVLEILKYFPEDDVKKIPKSLMDTFEHFRDKSYKYHIAPDQDFSKLVICDETEAIIINLFKDYWATTEQREAIQNKIEHDIMKMKLQQYESLMEEEDDT